MSGARTIEELLVKIGGNDAGFIATARRVRQEATGLKSSLTGLGKSLGLAFGGLTVAAGLREIVKQSEETQAATAQLQARLKSTGGAAGLTLTALEGLAQGLQTTTVFSNEATKGAESLLLTFKSIKGDTFREATRATLDLAAAMAAGNGGVPDLRSAALQVGKALEDPATQMTYLRRSGVSFTQQQIDLVKHLEKTGQHAQAQAIILKELQSEFGGAASAARNTLGGALTYLKNQFTDTLKVSQESSQGIIRAINWLGEEVGKLGTPLNDFLITPRLSEVMGRQLTAGLDTLDLGQLKTKASQVRTTIAHLTAYRPETLKLGFFETPETGVVDKYLVALNTELRAVNDQIRKGTKAGKESTDAAAAAANAWNLEYQGVLSSWRRQAAGSKEQQDLLVKGIEDAQRKLAGLEFQRAFETNQDAAKKLGEQIAEATAQLQAMNRAAAMLHIDPDVIKAGKEIAAAMSHWWTPPTISKPWWLGGTEGGGVSVPNPYGMRPTSQAPPRATWGYSEWQPGKPGTLLTDWSLKPVTDEITDQVGQARQAIEKGGMQMGESLISGFLTGANNAKDLLRGFLADLASQEIMGTLKKALGIHSPSKQGAYVGAMLGEGIMVGLRGYSRQLHATMDGLAVSARLQSTTGAGSGGGAVNLHQSLTWNVNALDSRDVLQVLEQHAPAIAAGVADTIERMPRIRRRIRGTT